MTRGIIFHYFWNDEIVETQGALNPEQFRKIIDYCATNYNLLGAEEYYEKVLKGSIGDDDICLTFDDGLYSQYAVAEPILREKGLTAFFFVYTSPMVGVLEKIEVYRSFRNSYSSINDFYTDFFSYLSKRGNYYNLLSTKEARAYYQQYEYYTDEDRLFRYARDILLKEQYDVVMQEMMNAKRFDPVEACKKTWIDRKQLKEIKDRGNIIGLHSHSHPTSLKLYDYYKKYEEYYTNYQLLKEVVGEINVASYPCDSYDIESERILRELGIRIAFIASTNMDRDFNAMKISRTDASRILG